MKWLFKNTSCHPEPERRQDLSVELGRSLRFAQDGNGHRQSFLMVTVVLLLLSSCSILAEDLTAVKELASYGQYEEAITILDSYKSNSSNKYNASLRIEYGEKILKDLESDQQARYREAKNLFERALELDPKNTRARVLYLTVLKLIKDDQA